MKIGGDLSETYAARWDESSKQYISKLINEVVNCPEIGSPIVVYESSFEGE